MAFYKTSSSDYGAKWAVSNEKKPVSTDIPSYGQIGSNLPQFRKTEKLLKNQLVAAKWGMQEEAQLDEISAAKKKLDANAVTAKKFPVQPGEYKIPGPGLKVGNPLYMTTSMDVGRLQPSAFEIADRYHPLDNKFSKAFSGGMPRNTSLNTAQSYSKVHGKMDGNFGNFY